MGFSSSSMTDFCTGSSSTIVATSCDVVPGAYLVEGIGDDAVVNITNSGDRSTLVEATRVSSSEMIKDCCRTSTVKEAFVCRLSTHLYSTTSHKVFSERVFYNREKVKNSDGGGEIEIERK